MTHYEVAYGQQPPLVVSYNPGTSKVNVMDSFLQNWEATLATLKENMEMTQNCMKQEVDQHHFDHSFEEGD